MPPADVEFARVIIGSVAGLGLLGLAYFRWFGRRAKIAVVRRIWMLPPTVALVSVAALIALDLPPFAKALACVLGGASVLVCLSALIVIRSTRSVSRPRQRRGPRSLV